MISQLMTILLGASAITTITGARIWPGSIPQGEPLPALVVNRISGRPLYADDGETGLEENRVQIDCYALTYTLAESLRAAVQSTLSAYVADAVFPYIMLDVTRDLRDGGSKESEYPFRISMDFIIWYRSA
jgi:hypothetical protein